MDGNPAMYQDPLRGRIQGYTTDAEGFAPELPLIRDFEQNLSGENSIAGRGIWVLFDLTNPEGETVATPATCCTIVLEEAPTGWSNPQMTYQP